MTPQFYRLVWKEYRAQRTFWLALLIGHALLSVLFLFTSGFIEPLFIGLAVVLSASFGVGSVALEFSGEEEEGTAIWPRMFPVSTTTLVSAKLTWTVVSMLALLLICLGVSAAVGFLGRSWVPAVRVHHSSALTLEDALTMGAMMACVVSWAIVCSLRSRKVITALAASGILFAVSLILIFNLVDRQRYSMSGLYTVVLILLIALNARRWHLGLRSFKAPASVANRRPLVRLAGITTIWRVFWLPTLKWAAARPTLNVRTAMVLLWRECRFAAWFGVCFLACGPVLFAVQAMNRDEVPPTLLLIMVVVIEAGLRSFRNDQQQVNGMFWSHRGISPALVWIIRTGAWLMAMFAVIVGLVLLEYLFVLLFGPAIGHLSSIKAIREVLVDERIHPDWFGYRIYYGFVAAGVGGFAVAQLASCWNRKPLLGFFAAIIGVVSLWSWIGYVTHFAMPLWLLVWPIIAVIFLAGFLTRRQWMDRRSGLKIYLWRSIGIIFPALCLWPMSQLWWATEIPASAMYYASIAIDDEVRNSAAVRFGYTAENATGSWAAAWTELKELTPPADHGQHQAALAAIDEINIIVAESPSDGRLLPPQLSLPWVAAPVGVAATNVLLFEANRNAEDGNADESLQRIIESIHLGRLCLNSSANWGDWYATLSRKQFALSMLRSTASNDDLTVEQLSHVMQQLEEICNRPLRIDAVPMNRFLAYEQLINPSGYVYDLFLTPMAGKPETPGTWPYDLVHASSASQERFLRLCAVYVDYWNGTGRSTQQERIRWKYLTPLANSWFDEYPEHGEVSVKESAQNVALQGLINDERATAVVLAMQIYRRKHGTLPESLSQLEDVGMSRDDVRLRDVTCDVEFGYAPNGYGMPVPVSPILTLDSSQPLLWSHGPISPRALSQLDRVGRLPVQSLLPNVIYFSSGTGMNTFHQPDVKDFQRRITRALDHAKELSDDSPAGAEDGSELDNVFQFGP